MEGLSPWRHSPKDYGAETRGFQPLLSMKSLGLTTTLDGDTAELASSGHGREREEGTNATQSSLASFRFRIRSVDVCIIFWYDRSYYPAPVCF